MVVLGGIVGFVVGFGVGLLITEVIFSNPGTGDPTIDWAFWTDIVLSTLGALVGVTVTRHLARRGVNQPSRG
jgi:cation transporter-like permease